MALTIHTNRDGFVAHLLSRVWKDEAYRQRLLANPKAVLAEELGTEIPEGVEVRVLQEEKDLRYLVIPYKRDNFQPPMTDANSRPGVATSSVVRQRRQLRSHPLAIAVDLLPH